MITADRLLEIAFGNAGFALALALVAVLAGRMTRRPTVRHLLWLVVLVRLVAPPVVELAMLPAAPPAAPAVVVAPPAAADETTPAATTPMRLQGRDLALLAWLAGTAALLGLSALRITRLIRTLRAGHDASPDLEDRVAALASRVGVRPPTVRVVDCRVPPMVLAAGARPVLVLPGDLLDQLGEKELDSVLAHELAHLRRRDHVIRYLELAAVAVFWWNPVAWWASRNLRAAEEECCDDLVASSLPGHECAYVQGMVTTMRFLAGTVSPVPAVVAGAGHFATLERRIRMIMARTRARTLSRPTAVVVAAIAAAGLILSPTLAARSGGPGFNGDPVDLNLERANLQQVLEIFAELTGLTVVIDGDVPVGQLNAPITIAAESEPWDQVLDRILQQAHLAWRSTGNVLLVHLPGATPQASEPTALAPSSGDVEPINLSLKDADIRDVLSTFEQLTGRSVKADAEVSGTVTIRLLDVPWDEALRLVLEINGYAYTDDGVTISVKPANAVGGLMLGVTRFPDDESPSAAATVGKLDGEPVYRVQRVEGGVLPRKLFSPQPEYTDDARNAGIEGVIVIEAVIHRHGNVARARVERGLPLGLDEAALEAVRTWRFEPATIAGEPVAAEFIVTARFSLD